MGKMESRTLKSKSYMTSLPGAPDGEYVVTSSTRASKKKAAAVRNGHTCKDKNGVWKVRATS